MEQYDSFSIIQIILELALLICFFVLVFDVSKIKKALYCDENYFDLLKRADEEKYIGNMMEYREYLLRAEWRMHKKIESLKSDSPFENPEIKFLEGQILEIEEKIKEIKL